jgi:hypothetical protein
VRVTFTALVHCAARDRIKANRLGVKAAGSSHPGGGRGQWRCGAGGGDRTSFTRAHCVSGTRPLHLLAETNAASAVTDVTASLIGRASARRAGAHGLMLGQAAPSISPQKDPALLAYLPCQVGEL